MWPACYCYNATPRQQLPVCYNSTASLPLVPRSVVPNVQAQARAGPCGESFLLHHRLYHVQQQNFAIPAAGLELAEDQHPRAAVAGTPTISRRQSLAAVLAAAGAAGVSLPKAAVASSVPLPPGVVCADSIQASLLEALSSSVASAVTKLQVMDLADFNQEVADLQKREYKYFEQANRDRIQGADQAAQAASLNANFSSYVMWKVVARHVQDEALRTQFCLESSAALLRSVWPQGLTQAASIGKPGPPSEAAVVQLVQGLLGTLQQQGYCCGWQLVWGEQPGGWPQDWMVTQPQLAGFTPLTDSPAPPGTAFQIKVLRPLDIEGSIAMRSEEEGFWSRRVSCMLLLLLEAAGCQVGPPSVDEFFYQDAWVGPSRASDQLLLLLGDPLEQVAIDFIPTTLIQNWTL